MGLINIFQIHFFFYQTNFAKESTKFRSLAIKVQMSRPQQSEFF